MKPIDLSGWKRRIEPGLALTLLLTLFVAIPLLSNSGLPTVADAESQVAAALLAAGVDMDAQVALRWLIMLGFLTCSGGMYLFCSRRSGRLGALIAGLVYVYSPSILFALPEARGALADLLALALLPLLLWRVDALRDQPTWYSFLLVVALQAALICVQSPLAVLLTCMAFVWLILETLVQRFNQEAGGVEARGDLLALLALLLGILAAATFWLPSLSASESFELAQLDDTHFIALETLLAPTPITQSAHDHSLPRPPNLGIAQWLLALIGAASALWLYIYGYRSRHPQTFLGASVFTLLAVCLISLMLPTAQDTWNSLLPLQYLRLPRLLLGPAAICLAIVASMNGLWLERLSPRYRISMIGLAVALPIVVSIPQLLPGWEFAPPDSSAVAVAAEPAAVESNVSLFASLVSLLGLLGAGIATLMLRRADSTKRPYASPAPLSRPAFIGALLGAAVALLTLAIRLS